MSRRYPRRPWMRVLSVAPPSIAGVSHDHLIVRGAREHNLKDVSSTCPATPHRLHRPVRLGQVQPGLRHDLRRGPAPLRRVAVGVRPAVPRPDGQARRRLHRGAVARPSRSTRSRPTATRAPRSAPSPRSTTTCACSSPAPAARTARSAASRSPGRAPQQIVDRLLELPEGTRFQVLAPVVRGRKGEYVDLFAELQTKGFARARVDGEVVALTEPPKLEKQVKHTIEVVVDRLVAKGPTTRRQAAAHRLGRDRARPGRRRARRRVRRPRRRGHPDRERRFSEKLACPNDHPLPIDEVEPRSFSFNSPFGACPECTGIGTELEVDPELHRPRRGPQPRRGRDRAVGQRLGRGRLLPAAAWPPWPTTSASRSTRRGAALPQRAQEALLHGTEPQGARPLPQPVRPRALLLHRLRGRRRRSSSAGTPRPSPTGAGSATRATCARCRARPARAPGSSPSRSPS